MKKVISIILTATLLLTLFVTVPLTAEAKKSGDFIYTVTDGEAEITTYTGSESELTIPSEFDGVPVTSIGEDAFENCSTLKSVIIPDSVITIGYSAFSDCRNLESVNLGNSVTKIGECAFSLCVSLGKITFPDSLCEIGYYAFYNTKWLNYKPEGVVYVGEIVYDVKGDCPDEVVLKEGTKAISEGAFEDCKTLKSITIPDSVTTIGYKTFDSCTSLESITIPDSVTTIGGSAFYGCVSLESITIPDSVTTIGADAFGGCVSLESATILNPNVNLNYDVFENCNDLTIYGYSGSTAEKYAKEYDIPFVSIGGELPTEPETTEPDTTERLPGADTQTETQPVIDTVPSGSSSSSSSASSSNSGSSSASTSYSVTDISNLNVRVDCKYASDGTAVVTITGAGNCQGTITKKVKIEKAENPVKVTAKKTVTANANKKTTIKKAITVKNAQGKVTYKTNNKKVTVKKGNLIVAKGFKKGKTIKVKITITAKGNSNYKLKKIVKTVSIKFK